MNNCGEKTEVFSRVVGFYRPVQAWNNGKQQEFKERKTFNPKSINSELSPRFGEFS